MWPQHLSGPCDPAGTESSQLAAQLALDEEVRMPAGMPAHAESAAAAALEAEPVNQVEEPDLR